MTQQTRTAACRNHIVCVDSYDDGVLKGRFYHSGSDMEHFSSLSQFFLKMEELLDVTQMPQSFTAPRRFSTLLRPEYGADMPLIRKGIKATFDMRVIFRQHSSWQGTILWREGNIEQSFRSVLELVRLMDSALRSLEGGWSA